MRLTKTCSMRITSGKIVHLEDIDLKDVGGLAGIQSLPTPWIPSKNSKVLRKISGVFDFYRWKDEAISHLGPNTQVEITKNPKRKFWYDAENIVTILSH